MGWYLQQLVQEIETLFRQMRGFRKRHGHNLTAFVRISVREICDGFKIGTLDCIPLGAGLDVIYQIAKFIHVWVDERKPATQHCKQNDAQTPAREEQCKGGRGLYKDAKGNIWAKRVT